MADVFLSYASEDRARIAPLARALADAGFSLWWDRNIPAGSDFAQTIEREITAATAVVLAWSETSVRSQWVRDEAAFARDAGKLIPLLIDASDPPMGFRQIQAIDLRDWHGDPRSPAFAALVTAVRERLARDGARLPEPTKPVSTAHPRAFLARRRAPLIAALVLAAGALATWAWLQFSAPGAHIALGEVEVQSFAANPPDPARAALAASYAAAFRERLTESGIRNAPAAADRREGRSELVLSGELNDQAGRNILSVRIDDRRSGATLYTVRGEPTEGAAWEANLAGFALKCALKRRDPALGPDVLSRYIYGCAHFLERDFAAMHAVAKELHEAAPKDSKALGFYAVALAGLGWGQARSAAEHDRFLNEAARVADATLQLDPHNADALFTKGFTLSDSQFAEQETWWRRALDADPELAWALGRYARLLSDVGRVREAIDVGLRAQMQRRVVEVQVARQLASLGDQHEAHAQYEIVRPMNPQRVAAQELVTDVLYGDVDAAAKALRERPEAAGTLLPCLTQMLAVRRRQPVDAARYAAACSGGGEFSARAFALAGNLDAAYRELNVYLDPAERSIPQLFWPEMRGFIRDPRFWPLAARFGFVEYWLQSGQWPDFCSEPDLPFDCKVEATKIAGAPAAQ